MEDSQNNINKIVQEIHNSDVFPFFQEQFDKFCKMIEDYGLHVENCSKNPSLYVDINKEKQLETKREKLSQKYQEYVNQEIDIEKQIEEQKDITKNNALIEISKEKLHKLHKELTKFKKELETLPTRIEPPEEGCIEYVYDAFMYIDLPFLYPKQKRNKSNGRFWIMPEYVNPTMWFNDIMSFSYFSKDQPILKDADKLLCNAVILAVTHDEFQERDVTNNSVYRNKTYKGKYFRCNKFCRDLWEKLQARPERIVDANTDIKKSLDEWLEKNKSQANGGEKENKIETEENAESKVDLKGNIHIQNFNGILGDVQAENVQTGDNSKVLNYTNAEKNDKGIFKKLLKIIFSIIAFFAALFTCLYYLDWLEPVKSFILKLFLNR